MRSPRLLAVLLVGLLAFGTLVWAKGGERGPVPVDASDCAACHRADDVPMEVMAAMAPPESFLAPSDAAGADLVVQVSNGWVQRPELNFIKVATTLDLTAAPSLRFIAANADITDLPAEFQVTLNLTAPADAQQGTTTYEVPVGASAVEFRIVPRSADLAYRFVVRSPAGEPVVQDVEAGAEGKASFDAAALAERGAGNWTVGAEVRFIDPAGGVFPTTTAVVFDTFETVRFAEGAARKTTFTYGASVYDSVLLRPRLMTWRLAAVGEPGPGETVTLTTNTTAYFDHLRYANTRAVTGDWGNFTESVVLRVEPGSGGARLVPGTVVALRPDPINGPTIVTVSEAIGYASAFLLVSSIVSGGMLGKASRRGLNVVFGSAKRRVAFHNILSYGIITAAAAHTVLFLIEPFYSWTLGLIWGTIAMLCMLGLGVTGALQVPMIRRWDYGTWRWWHYGLTVGVLVFTVVHGLLDGVHFGQVQEWLGWSDPLDPEL